jgi:myo-inositol 2-dehydrogenase/D-chiro-inositol 1-dehydrogenase
LVDAVIITSPDETHEEYVLSCVRAGKPVLCEKPLAPTADACERIVRVESASGKRLVQVGYMRRFDPSYLALKAALDKRIAGNPLVLHCAHRAHGPSVNRTVDMMLSNAAVHDFDAARWLLGEEIVSAVVHLPSSSRLSRGQYDPLLIVLRTESEAIIDLEIFVNAGYGCDVRTEVVCESGVIGLARPSMIRVTREGQEASPVAQDTFEDFADAYREEIQAWVDAVSRGAAVDPSAWDGYAATAVADAGRESVTTGHAAQVRLESRLPLYS